MRWKEKTEGGMDGEGVYYCKNGGTEEKREEVSLKVE